MLEKKSRHCNMLNVYSFNSIKAYSFIKIVKDCASYYLSQIPIIYESDLSFLKQLVFDKKKRDTPYSWHVILRGQWSSFYNDEIGGFWIHEHHQNEIKSETIIITKTFQPKRKFKSYLLLKSCPTCMLIIVSTIHL